MKKIQYVIIVFLSIFIMPENPFACGKKEQSEKSCCTKEVSSKGEKTSCCNKSDNSEKECGGKCGHSSCTTASVAQFSILNSFVGIDVKNIDFHFYNEKAKFFHSDSILSSGFRSLWLIPKIS